MSKQATDDISVAKFDAEAYRKDLEMLTKLAYDEYRHVAVEMKRYQLSYARTYLWAAALFVGTGASGFWFLMNPEGAAVSYVGAAPALFYVYAVLAFLLATAALGIGIDALRGRGEGTILPIDDLDAFMKIATASAQSTCGTPHLCERILEEFRKANIGHIKCRAFVGKRLRLLSKLLIWSLFFGTTSLVCRFSSLL